MPTNAINDTGVKYLYDKLHGEIEQISDIVDDSISHKSGNPISITGLKSTQNAINPIVTLEPIQDLHGQDKPYPAGGGKNKYGAGDANGTTYVTMRLPAAIEVGTYTFSAVVKSTDTDSNVCLIYDVTNSASLGTINRSNGNQRVSKSITLNNATSTLRFYASDYGVSSSGDDLSFTNIQIESGSSPTPFAPYENICPISGYDKIEVLSCGKNLFDKGLLLDQATWNTFELTLKPNTTYTMSTNVSESKTSELAAYFLNENISPSPNQLVYSGHSISVLTTSQGIVKIQQRRISGTDSFQNYNWQIEENNQSTSYEPYHKITDLSYELSETVYGGELDVESGVLTVTHGIADLGTKDWNYHASTSDTDTNRFSVLYKAQYLSDAKVPNAVDLPNAVCEIYQPSSNTQNVNGGNTRTGYISITTGGNLVVTDTRFTSPSDLKSALNGMHLVYELDDSAKFTIQLTPTELTLLKDYAYVSTNGTRIDLDYRNGEMATLEDVLDAQNKLQEEIDNPISYDGKNYRLGMDATGLYLYNITDDTKAYIQMVTP